MVTTMKIKTIELNAPLFLYKQDDRTLLRWQGPQRSSSKINVRTLLPRQRRNQINQINKDVFVGPTTTTTSATFERRSSFTMKRNDGCITRRLNARLKTQRLEAMEWLEGAQWKAHCKHWSSFDFNSFCEQRSLIGKRCHCATLQKLGSPAEATRAV
jgi:hypothetical protein